MCGYELWKGGEHFAVTLGSHVAATVDQIGVEDRFDVFGQCGEG